MNDVHEGSPALNAYGYMWWTNRANTYPDYSHNLYLANGFGGNYIVVDNEHDVVIVTRWLEPAKLSEFLKLMYKAYR